MKRGQFYLLAAIVIISIIIGLGVVNNKINAPSEDIKTYDLSKEIEFEGSKVIDQGVISGTPDQLLLNLEDLISIYSDNYPESEIAVVYGDSKQIDKLSTYYRVEENNIRIGDTAGIKPKIKSQIPISEINQQGNKVKILLPGDQAQFTFQVDEGQNFYVIVRKEKGDQKFVVQSG